MLVWAAAISTRVVAAFVLPNAEQDGYSYAEIIRDWSVKLSDGTFRAPDLFGFWLPGFQFVAALFNLLIRDPLLAGKLVAAFCGAITCVLVFFLAHRTTRSVGFALCAFALIVIDPLHLIYSGAAMTDVPFICLVLGSVAFVSAGRWTLAAILAATAGGVRIEGWILLLAIPLLQFWVERRVSLLTILILLLPPVLWLGISRYAAGDWQGYFAKRASYQNRFMDFYPSRRGFGFADIVQDLNYFFLGANPVTFIALIGAAVFFFLRAPRSAGAGVQPPLSAGMFAAAIFALLLLGYVTKRQPVILPRYGLVFFALGLPAFVWLMQRISHSEYSKWLRGVVIAGAFALCLLASAREGPMIAKIFSDYRAQERIGTKLVSVIQTSRCFCDDPAVRVLARLPADRFLRSETTPISATQNAEAFLHYLHDQGVNYLVFVRTEDSFPVMFFPELGHRTKLFSDNFQMIKVAPSFFGPDVWLYHLGTE